MSIRLASNSPFGRYRRIAARLPTYIADAVENPAWLAMFILARLGPMRRVYKWLRPAREEAADDTIFSAAKLKEIVGRLETDGIAPSFLIPRPIVDDIHEFTRVTPCFGNLDRKLEFLSADHAGAEAHHSRPILTGNYFDRIENCAAVKLIQQDPMLRLIAKAYLGRYARLAATRLWWSFPTQPREADLHLASQERFHFDLDDWQTLKFFFYLTSVDHNSGPHVFVRGSHRGHFWKHQLTLLVGHPAEEVLAAYGAENVRSITGSRGFGFAEDPFGFHMGTAPRRAPRLMLEIAFGVSSFSKRRFYGEPIIL